MTDDLTRMRAKRIARAHSTEQIRAALREAAGLCPTCQRQMREHTETQLDTCALGLPDGA